TQPLSASTGVLQNTNAGAVASSDQTRSVVPSVGT
ncbi:hypothetical protein A2U01_0011343, partial [Trifolium medium]|nr:hypothetical protein [Trifolium medium]